MQSPVLLLAAAAAIATLAHGVLAEDDVVVTAATFTQRLDHFNAREKRTWTQQYFKAGPFSAAGAAPGPVVILLGGLEAAAASTLEDSHALEIAQQLKGVAFLLEHRFFGASIPTEDMTLASLRYLTQDQALADVASFIEHLRASGQAAAASKVILYGGLRAGNLAAWARLKYPHLVHAAVASSAPLRARAAYTEWMDVDMSVLQRRGGDKCRRDVRDAIEYLDQTLSKAGGQTEVAKLYGLCAEPGRWDAEMLFERLTSAVSGAVNIEKTPYMDMVQEACYMFDAAPTARDKAQALGSVAGLGMAGLDCEDVSLKQGIAAALPDRWGQAVSAYNEQLTDRLLLFMSCFEFGQFQALPTEWKNHCPLELALQKCTNVFGKAFSAELLEEAIRRSNMEFGAASPDLRRVVFVRGQDDPYAALGVAEDDVDSALAPVVEIPEAQHCRDMQRSQDEDPQGVKDARVKIVKYLDEFLKMSP